MDSDGCIIEIFNYKDFDNDYIEREYTVAIRVIPVLVTQIVKKKKGKKEK